MAIAKVGIVGCGLMGSGIAQVAAQSGFPTFVREVSQELLDKGLKNIDKNLARLMEKGALADAQKSEIRGRLKGTTTLDDLKGCDVIIEAIIEQLPAKRELFSSTRERAVDGQHVSAPPGASPSVTGREPQGRPLCPLPAGGSVRMRSMQDHPDRGRAAAR